MSEDIQARVSQPTREAEASSEGPQPHNKSQVSFPEEAFPCPHCGQMLGPAVRVCVACRQAIDPNQIRVTAAAPVVVAARAGAIPRVRFSWIIFLAVLLAGLALGVSVMTIAGVEKAQYALVAAQVVLAAWVFSDARQKGFPRPFRWGAGTLLFWVVFLPWYLARRRQPGAKCPMVESGLRPFLLILVFCFGTALLLVGAIASRLPNLLK